MSQCNPMRKGWFSANSASYLNIHMENKNKSKNSPYLTFYAICSSKWRTDPNAKLSPSHFTGKHNRISYHHESGQRIFSLVTESNIQKRTDKLSLIKIKTSVHYKTQLGKRMIKAQTGIKYSQNMYLTKNWISTYIYIKFNSMI